MNKHNKLAPRLCFGKMFQKLACRSLFNLFKFLGYFPGANNMNIVERFLNILERLNNAVGGFVKNYGPVFLFI